MNCPTCGTDTDVVDSRPARYGIRRRRVCKNPACKRRFTTKERISSETRSRQLEPIQKLLTQALASLEQAINERKTEEAAGEETKPTDPEGDLFAAPEVQHSTVCACGDPECGYPHKQKLDPPLIPPPPPHRQF